MEARQLTNPFEYVARCRHWKQFQFDRQQAIQSLPSSSSRQTEAHLPVLATGTSQQQPPCPPPNELVSLVNCDPRESANTGRNLSSQAAPQPRAQETNLASPRTQHGYRAESHIIQAPLQPQPGSLTSPAYQTPARGQVSQNEASYLTQSSAADLTRPQQQMSAPQARSADSGRAESMISEGSSDVLCRVCYDKPFNVVLVPCGHFAVCSSCAERCKDCPICRRPIRGTVRINYSH